MKLFAVVGMHRSGTSLVSRITNLVGASLGPPDDLMPAKPDNPHGFWESLSVTQLHDDLLGTLGGPWASPPPLPEGWEDEERLTPFVDRIRGLVASHFASERLALWKDPRGSLLLPLWRRVVPIAGTILCVRDPRDVARSLLSRNRLEPEHCATLWLTYTLSTWHNDAACLVVPFEQAHSAPRALATRLAAFMGEPAPGLQTLCEVEACVDTTPRTAAPGPSGATIDDAAEGPSMRLARAVHGLVQRAQAKDVAARLRTLSRDFRAGAASTTADAALALLALERTP